MSILSGRDVCRLYWDPGHGGSATRKGRTVPLAAPPDLGAGPVYCLDFVPGSLATVTRTVSDRADDMRQDEISAAREFLQQFVPSAPAPL